jgi:Protein of unknown function (DUF1573)
MTRWISLACALIVLTGAATFVYQTLPDAVPEPTIELHGRKDTGPPPRLELVGDPIHNFGTMVVEVKGSHAWEFKNVGVGPLEVWLEQTTCSCTVATLKSDDGKTNKKVTVPPGGSTPIEVTWEGHRWGAFGHKATLGTNDPDRPEVELTVHGKMIAPVDVQPSETIAFPDFPQEEGHRTKLAIVSSDLPDLKLIRIETSRPDLIKVQATPMAAAELERRKVKSGYDLTVEIKPGMAMGRFTEGLMIDTNHPRRSEMKLTIAGTVIGPIRVVPDRLQMISVASHKGASKDLALIVRGDRETHFEVASRPEGVAVTITRDEKSGAKGRYRLTVTVPPGTPPGVLSHPIVLKTDHPQVAEVRIPVSIIVSARPESG